MTRWAGYFASLSLLVASVCGCGSDPVSEAWRLFGEGDIDEARANFETSVGDPSLSARAHLALGELALLRNDLDGAETEFAAAVSAQTRAEALTGYGEALLRSGRRDEAYAAFGDALDSDADELVAPRIAGLIGDGYATKRLTGSRWDNYAPSFMPDGQSIVYTSHGDGNGELTRLDLRTLDSTTLVRMPETNEYGAHSSPDGRVLVFGSVQHHSLSGVAKLQASGSGARNEILHIADIETGEHHALTASSGPVANPTFSADGSLIVFEAIVERNLDIWTMDANGRNRTRLTTGPEDDGQPMPHPNGQSIVFLQTRNDNFDLMEVGVADGLVKEVTRTPFHEYAGSFSGDGSSLVFVRHLEGNKELALMDWSTRRVRTLSRGSGNAIQPAFSPDGSKIVFVSDRNDYLELYLMDLTRPMSAGTLKRELMALRRVATTP